VKPNGTIQAHVPNHAAHSTPGSSATLSEYIAYALAANWAPPTEITATKTQPMARP
jgi:hypothetical protein